MKSLLKRSGFSARQKATNRNEKVALNAPLFSMLVLATALITFSCHEKTNGQSADTKKDHLAVTKDSVFKPRIDVKVNRHYDDQGNMIGFDSTYTSYYSNIKGDTTKMDSLMHSFDRYFKQDHASFLFKELNPLFFSDSLRYPDFFHDDFFMKRYELNDPYLRRMMNRMDSIKNRFYEESYQKRKKGKES